jgi:hypothetical protein
MVVRYNGNPGQHLKCKREGSMYCPFCGTRNMAEARYCQRCGKEPPDASEELPTAARTIAPRQAVRRKVKKRRTPLWAQLLGAALVLFFGWSVIASLFSDSNNLLAPTPNRFLQPIATSPPTTRSVVYTVKGSNGASRAFLTYANAQSGTEQNEITLPWSKSITVPKGQFLYISAQNKQDSGGVSCDITVDGRSLKHSESSGAYVIASCDGSAP